MGAAALAQACSPDGNAALSDGARLRALHWTAEDGSRAFYGEIFDEQLGVRCRMDTAADGKVRCLPEGGYVYHADAECTVRMIVGPPCEPPPRFGREDVFPAAGSCDEPRARIYAAGDALGPVSSWFQKVGSECVATAPFPDLAIWEAGREIEPEELVELRAAEVPRGGDLSAIYVEGDDGFRRVVRGRDLAHDTDCFASDTAAGARCVPITGVSASLGGPAAHFADPGCSEPAGLNLAAPCGAPSALMRVSDSDQGTCVEDMTIHRTGEPVASAYESVDGVCTPVQAEGDPSFFRIGEAVSPSELPAVERVTQGSGRLVTVRWERNGGAVGLDPLFRDTALGAGCRPALFEDGTHRCLPERTEWVIPGQITFADDACTVPLASQQACGPVSEYAVYASQSDLCSVGARVHELGPPHTGETYAVSLDGACLPANPWGSLRTLGPEVPLDTFAVLAPPE